LATAQQQRELTGRALRDPELENFVQKVFTGMQPPQAWQAVWDPDNKKSKRSWSAGGNRLLKNELVAERLNTLYAARAAATIAEEVISQHEVMELIVKFSKAMHVQGLPQHEAKALDMLAKATGVYKAPEKNESARERTDAEIMAELKALGLGPDDNTPNRRKNGPGRRTEGQKAADLQTLPETEGLSRTRPN